MLAYILSLLLMGIDLIETTTVWTLKEASLKIGKLTKRKNKILMSMIVKYFCCFISLCYYMRALKVCSEMFRGLEKHRDDLRCLHFLHPISLSDRITLLA